MPAAELPSAGAYRFAARYLIQGAVVTDVCVYSADRTGAERDTDRGQLDIRDSGDGLVAERRMCGRVVRRRAAGDGNVGLAHGREQHPGQRRQ